MVLSGVKARLRTISGTSKLPEASRLGIVPAWVGITVGVAEAGIAVAGTTVWVGTAVSVGEMIDMVDPSDVGVDKTLTEKVQASSASVANARLMINWNKLRGFIVFSRLSLSVPDGRIAFEKAEKSVVGIPNRQ